MGADELVAFHLFIFFFDDFSACPSRSSCSKPNGLKNARSAIGKRYGKWFNLHRTQRRSLVLASRIRKTLLCRLTLVFSIASSLSASATTIVFTHESSGSGTLNGVPFSARAFTIRATGDTTNRQSLFSQDVFFIDHTSVRIEIAGLGTFEILSPTRTFVNQTAALAGFSRASSSGVDLLNGPTDELFASWDMLSSIGPIAGDGYLLQWENLPVNTSVGILTFDSQPTIARFTASIDNADSDGDEVPDSQDQCPNTPVGVVVDAHGCSIEQLVPCAGPLSGGRWKNRGEYVSAMSKTAAQFVAQGLITVRAKGAIISAAARSDCGK